MSERYTFDPGRYALGEIEEREVPIDRAECEHGVILSERLYGTLDCPLHTDGRAMIRLIPVGGPTLYDKAW